MATYRLHIFNCNNPRVILAVDFDIIIVTNEIPLIAFF